MKYGTRANKAETIIRVSNAKSTTGAVKYPILKGLDKVPSLVECSLESLAYSLDWLDLGTYSAFNPARS
jgi:hypothetical protein